MTRTMKWILVLGYLSIFVFNVQGQGKCTKTPLKLDINADGSNLEYCEYTEDAASLPVELLPGSEFVTKDCTVCKCSATGLACCEKNTSPSKSSIPAGCVVISNGCDFSVVLANNKGKDCYTGKPIKTKTLNHDKPMSINRLLSSPETFALINLVKKVFNHMQSKPKMPQHNNPLHTDTWNQNLHSSSDSTVMNLDTNPMVNLMGPGSYTGSMMGRNPGPLPGSMMGMNTDPFMMNVGASGGNQMMTSFIKELYGL